MIGREEMICRLLARAGRCRTNRAYGRTYRQASADVALAGKRRVEIEEAGTKARRDACKIEAMMEEIRRQDAMILRLASALGAALDRLEGTKSEDERDREE